MSTIDRNAIRRLAVEGATVLSEQSFEVVLAKLAATVISERCSVRSWAPLWRSSSMKSSRSVDGGHRVSVA